MLEIPPVAMKVGETEASWLCLMGIPHSENFRIGKTWENDDLLRIWKYSTLDKPTWAQKSNVWIALINPHAIKYATFPKCNNKPPDNKVRQNFWGNQILNV